MVGHVTSGDWGFRLNRMMGRQVSTGMRVSTRHGLTRADLTSRSQAECFRQDCNWPRFMIPRAG
ncbi:MAG: hypothetical protein R3D29_05475 [Nitratireductor sp.]